MVELFKRKKASIGINVENKTSIDKTAEKGILSPSKMFTNNGTKEDISKKDLTMVNHLKQNSKLKRQNSKTVRSLLLINVFPVIDDHKFFS